MLQGEVLAKENIMTTLSISIESYKLPIKSLPATIVC